MARRVVFDIGVAWASSLAWRSARSCSARSATVSPVRALKAMGYTTRCLRSSREAVYLALFGFVAGLEVSVGLFAWIENATGLRMTLRPLGLAILGLTIVKCVMAGLLAAWLHRRSRGLYSGILNMPMATTLNRRWRPAHATALGRAGHPDPRRAVRLRSRREPRAFSLGARRHQGEIVIMTGPSGIRQNTLLTLIGALRQVRSEPSDPGAARECQWRAGAAPPRISFTSTITCSARCRPRTCA